MNEQTTAIADPLLRLTRTLPNGIGAALALGGRIVGSTLAIATALDQSYTGTRVFAVAVAVLVLLSCLPVPSRFRGPIVWVGVGLLFFGGAILAHIVAGMLMLLCGTISAVGVAVNERQHDRRSSALFFFAGFVVAVALVVAVVLGMGG